VATLVERRDPMLKKIMEILTLNWLWDRHEDRKDN
jgi:hypothetical protein